MSLMLTQTTRRLTMMGKQQIWMSSQAVHGQFLRIKTLLRFRLVASLLHETMPKSVISRFNLTMMQKQGPLN